MKSNLILRTAFLLCGAILLLTFNTNAQSFVSDTDTIGTGTSFNGGTGYPAPYAGYYWGARHQFIILASELPSACLDTIDTINSLSFDIASVNSCPSLAGYTIKIGHTTNTTAGSWVTGLTTVLTAATYTPSTGINTHTFNTPFAYNGTSNLVVEVCFNNTSWVSNGNASTRYTTTSFTSARYRRADATGVCSNTALTGTSANRPNMILGWSRYKSALDASLDAVSAPVASCSFGSSESVSVDITNNGTANITSLPMAYTINGGTAVTGTYSGTLTPGSSTTYTFSTTANLSSGSSFDIQIYNTASGDVCDDNDTTNATLATQMNGVYTIGGSTPDYSTIAAALSDLGSIGVCGPVTFWLRDGTYSGSNVIGAISGASSTNTITFKSDPSNSALAELTASSGHVWQFNASKYVSVDSLELTMTGSAWVVRLTGFNEHIAVRNCVINGSSASTTSTNSAVFYQSSSALDYFHDFAIEDNEINDGSWVTYLYGGFSTAVHNQNFNYNGNASESAYYFGVYLVYTDTAWHEGNSFNHESISSAQYGFYATSSTQVNFIGNDVTINTTSGGAYGIYFLSHGTSTSRSLCANNMIAIPNSNYGRGLYVGGYTYWDFINNSVRTKGISTSTAYACIYSTSATNTFRNNALHKDGVGYAFYTSTSATHDYNVIYTQSGTAYNTTIGTNSYNSIPGFVSTTDLHIDVLTNTYDNGITVTGITEDIDGETRSTTPDIGADEYDLPEDDAGIVGLDGPTSPLTAGSNAVSFSFKNYGIVTIDTVYLDWELNGSAQSSTTWTGTLAAAATQSNVSVGSATFSTGFSTIKGWTYDPNNETDENFENDTMEFTVCTGLSGTYTLGSGSGFDFETFEEAVDALETCGVSGAVTIDVDPGSGPYYEQVVINGPIAGASTTNTITFAGGGATLSANVATSDLALFRLNNVNHITIDSLNIESSSAYGWGVCFANGADSNTVQNCEITMPNSTSTYSLPIVFASTLNSWSSSVSGGNGNFNTIDNNVLNGGYCSVSMYASSATFANTENTISNNVMDAFSYYGVYGRYAPQIQIVGNDISRENSTVGATFYGIYLYYCTGGGINVTENRIHNANDNITSYIYGVYLYQCDGTSGSPNSFINNAIYNIGGSSYYTFGIQNYYSDYWNFYHNSIILEDASTVGYSYLMYTYNGTYNLNIKNNIFHVDKDAYGEYCLYWTGTSVSFSSDYNNFYVDPSNTGGYVARRGSNYAELTNWQSASTAFDPNSNQEDPIFANTAAGEVTPLINTVDNLGTPLSVTTDLEGDSRSSTTPDVGAIEFVGVAGDIGLVDATLIRVDACYNDEDTVKMWVKNVVGGTIAFATDNLTANWSVAGPVNSSGSVTISTGTLAANATMEISDDQVDMSIPGYYELTVWLDTNAVNESTLNDTINDAGDMTVDTIITVNPAFTAITSPYDSVNLVAACPQLFPEQAIFSEIIQWKYTGWQPSGGWPTWMTSDDNVELMGAPNASVVGYTIKTYYSNSATATHSYTFPSGSAFDANGVLVLGWGGTAGSVNSTYNYHSAGLNANQYGYTAQVGYVLTDANGDILDVATHTYTTGYTFNAAIGVTAADWSGTLTGTPASGVRRVVATDNNLASDWIQSYNNAVYQNPGQPNSEVDPVPAAYSGTSLEWSLNSTVFSNDQSIVVGPWTQTGVYTYIATLDSTCGVDSDTGIVDVWLTTALIVDSGYVSCNGGNDGFAVAAGEGGDSPYTYAWNTGATTDTVTGLTAGLYTVTVTDNNGWPDEAQINITEPDLLVASIDSTMDALCDGDANGYAEVSVTGGTTAYSYSWSNGSTTGSASSLDSGMVSVTVTDAQGCVAMDSALISDPDPLVITIDSVDDVLCAGFTTGAMYTTTTGGTTAYSYAWTGGSTAANLTSVASGTYTVTVTDANGCEAMAVDTVNELDPLLVSDSVNTPLCNGDTNGSIFIMPSGGLSPYGYDWSSGGSASSQSGLGAATYVISISDANNCLVIDSVVMTEPDVLTLDLDTLINSYCELGADGEIQLTTLGGTSAFTYMWADSTTTEDRTGLATGNYYVSVTDSNNCMYNDSFEVTFENAAPIVAISGSDTICFGETSTYTATSGYTYMWNTAATSDSIVADSAGMYSVTVTDSAGCENETATTLWINAELTLAIASVDATCNGGSDGTATATGGGGTGASTYSWSNGATGASISGLPEGTIVCGVSDSLGCSIEDSVTIDYINENPVVDLGEDTVVCFIPQFGTYASVTLDAGAGFTNYTWSTSETTSSIATTNPGAYSVIIEDANGCTGMDTINIDSVHCVGISFVENEIGLNIFPNPTLNEATITLHVSDLGDYQMTLRNIQGQVVQVQEMYVNSQTFTTQIQKGNLAAGVYTLRISNGDSAQNARLIFK